MSDEDTIDTSDTQMLTAEYKDGQLQIVEVTPFDRDKGSILPDIITSEGAASEDDNVSKYMQVYDPSGKGLVQLDLLNLTLVKCGDGEESYRLVTNSEDCSDIPADATVTCVLQSSDGEESDKQEYVMVDESSGLVFLQSSSSDDTHTNIQSHAQPSAQTYTQTPATSSVNIVEKKSKPLTQLQLLQRAKAIQKAKALMSSTMIRPGKRGRRRTSDIPPPLELLSSPNFKLYLYSCKLCTFKCNAIKELQAHRASEHSSNSFNKYRSGGGARAGSYIALQCAQCPYRGANHAQLMKHVQAKHGSHEEIIVSADDTVTTITSVYKNKVSLNTREVEEADVLVCGACGFESADRNVFKQHIENEHGATTT